MDNRQEPDTDPPAPDPDEVPADELDLLAVDPDGDRPYVPGTIQEDGS